MKVTVLLPPHLGGAPPCATLLFDKTPLQPPVALAVSSQREKALFTADWVWQAVVVVLDGQFSTTVGAAWLIVTALLAVSQPFASLTRI